MSGKKNKDEAPAPALWRFPALGAGLLMLWAFLRFAGPIDARSNDIWWHLTAGRQIAADAKVPRVDDFSHTKLGSPWIDFEWLFQLGAHAAANAAGLDGLVLLKSAVLAAQCGLLWLVLTRTGAAWPVLFPLAVFWIHILGARDYLRPEIFSQLFLTILLLLLEGRPLERRRIWLCAGLFALWANLHGGFALGLILLAAAAVGAQLEHSLARREPGPSPKAAALGLAVALSAAAACLNPYGTGVYAVIAEHGRMMSLSKGMPWQVMEWKPTPWTGYQLFWLYTILAAAACAASQLKRRKIDWADDLILLVFLGVAARYVRNAHFFVLASLPLFARQLRLLLPPMPELSERTRKASAWAACAALALLAARDWKARFDPRPDWNQVPAEAADFLAQHGCPGNLYNPYSWGGYLSWRLHPQLRVFMDSRYLFTEMLGQDHAARRSPAAWSAYLDGHKIACAVVAYPKGFKAVDPQRIHPGLLARPPRGENSWMFPAERWALVHWDRGSMIFARRQGDKPDPREYRNFRPDDYLFALARVKDGRLKRAAVLADVERRLAEAPDDPSARYFRRLFLSIP